jgi:hypothetical protein
MKASDAHLGVIPDLATHAVDGAVDCSWGHAARPGDTPRSSAASSSWHVLAFGIPWHACSEADVYLDVKLTSQASFYRRTCMAHA